MPKSTPIQQSFSAGEVSPKLYARSDTPGYQSGVSLLLNMRPDPRGPAMSRPGFMFNEEFAYPKGRVYTMQISDGTYFDFIFVNNKIIVSSPYGRIPQNNIIRNPRFAGAGSPWEKVEASNGVVSIKEHEVILDTTQPASVAGVDQSITIPTAGAYNLVVNTDPKSPYRVLLGTVQGGGDIYDSGVQIGRKFSVTIPAVPAGAVWLSIYKANSDGPPDTAIIRSVYMDEPTAVSYAELTAPWTEDQLDDIHFVAIPQGNVVYITHPNVQTQKLTYTSTETTDTFTLSAVNFTGAPPEWTGTTWPGTGAYFEGRLWLAGHPTSKETFWASKSASSEDFTLGSLADDGLEFVLQNRGLIKWLKGAKNLLIGTENSEYVVTSQGGVITPSDIQVVQQSSFGSSNVQPVQIGDEVIYISADRVKVRATQYDWQSDNWLSRDLTFFSDHITNAKIKDIVWQQNPDNILWCILEDGTCANLVYERGENIFGWYRCQVDGKILAMSSGTLHGESFVNAITQYQLNKTCYENVSRKEYYFDSVTERFSNTAFNTIDGLSHLEGKVVQVVVNDDQALHPDRVVAGGAIALDASYNAAAVGLKYNKKLVTLNVDKGSPTGSAYLYNKSLNRIGLIVHDSIVPTVNGNTIPNRHPATPMGDTEPLFTGVLLYQDIGWFYDLKVAVETEYPKPLNIQAIMYEYNVEIV